jgi:hypothetical protein
MDEYKGWHERTKSISIANMRFTFLTSSIIAAFSLIVAATPMPEVCFSAFTITAYCHFSLSSCVVTVG